MIRKTQRGNFVPGFVARTAVALAIGLLGTGATAYVMPKIGGGQNGSAPMIMPEITFDGSNVRVLDDNGNPFVAQNPIPILRPLTPPDAFDPAKAWSVLTGKAYNFQYGWDAGLLNPSLIPTGNAIWIKVVDQTPGLETYDRGNGYTPILGSVGATWKWPMGMNHNATAVLYPPLYPRYTARYSVYIGNSVTGEPNSAYGAAAVTLAWSTVVTVHGTVVLPGYVGDPSVPVAVKVELWQAGVPVRTDQKILDADGGCTLDNVTVGTYDIAVKAYASLQARLNNVTVSADPTELGTITLKGADSNGDDLVSFEDFALLQNTYGQTGADPLRAAGEILVSASVTKDPATGGCGLLGVFLTLGMGLSFTVLIMRGGD